MKRFGLMIAASLLSAFGVQASASRSCTTPENVNTLASEIARGINASRLANGQRQVSYNRKLGNAAMNHACDMASNQFFGHRGTDGLNSSARVRAAGYNHCLVGENLAWGYPRSEQIISGWMNSAGHRNIMLHPRIQEFGIGITMGPKGPNWVLVVAKSC